jgi:CheY-like chemotaxis protein
MKVTEPVPERFRILVVDDEQDFVRGLARLVSGRFADV